MDSRAMVCGVPSCWMYRSHRHARHGWSKLTRSNCSPQPGGHGRVNWPRHAREMPCGTLHPHATKKKTPSPHSLPVPASRSRPRSSCHSNRRPDLASHNSVPLWWCSARLSVNPGGSSLMDGYVQGTKAFRPVSSPLGHGSVARGVRWRVASRGC